MSESSRDTKVAVIIPTFDRAALLGRAVASVRAQTLPPTELLVVDQHSTDHTLDLLTQQSVAWVTDTSRGAGSARNMGLARTRSPFIVFLDSDDELMPTAIEVLSAKLSRIDAYFCFGAALKVSAGNPDGALSAPPAPGPLASTTIFKREIFQRVGPFDFDNYSFGRWIINARKLGVKETSINQVVAKRHLHEGNLSRASGSTQQLFDLVRAHRSANEKTEKR